MDRPQERFKKEPIVKKHLRIDCSLMPGNAAIPSGSRHPTLRVRALLGQRRGHADTELERYAAISEAILAASSLPGAPVVRWPATWRSGDRHEG
jgi:hypothetical protein